MKIALDGCDGVGKSTVAEKLANKFGCNIVRLTNGGDRSLGAYHSLMTCDNVVHDRTFISEIIYPKYFGRESRLNAEIVPQLFQMIESYDIKLFILTASNKTILERVGKRGDEFISDMSKFKEINYDYVTLAATRGFTVINTTDKTVDEIVEEIGGYLA